MFDDQPINPPGKPPSNLPLDPPEDMFSSTSDLPPVSREDAGMAEDESPSALEAGILRPKQTDMASGAAPVKETPTAPPMPSGPVKSERMITPPPMMGEREYAPTVSYLPERAGAGKIIFIIVLIILGAGLIGGGAWYVFMRMQGVDPLQKNPPVTPAITETEVVTPPADFTPPVTENNETTPDNTVLFGDPIDSDSDGLDDVREAELGTNAMNWDTDADGLSDTDEVLVWKTNPLSEDTDADGFGDNVEIKNGYNPAGPGKLFDPRPAETSGSASTTF